MSSEHVRRFYDNAPEKEWKRLTKNSYRRIEYEVTWHFIQKYLAPKARIIDIGGGPGRYTLSLLEQGHRATLVDLTPGLLNIARKEIKERNLDGALDGIYERNAVDLHGIPDATFDLSLLLGPFYHLTDADDRMRALREASRVTKPGGYIFTAIITRLSPIRDLFRWDADESRTYLLEKDAEVQQILDTCVYHNPTDNFQAFTDAYFAHTHDVPQLYDALGIEMVEAFSCEGIAAFLDDSINTLVNSEEIWKRLLTLIIATCTESSILGSGEHCVFIGRT